jgi:O-antigen/teichoic acid export membrane protein
MLSSVSARGRSWGRLLTLQTGQVVALVVGSAGLVLVSRLLGPERYGRLTLIFAVAQYMTILTANWTSASVIRFGRDEYIRTGSVRRIYWARLFLIVAGFLLATVVLVGMARLPLLAGFSATSLVLVCALSLVLMLADHADGVLQATGFWTRFAWLGAIEKTGFIVAALTMWFVFGELGLVAALGAAILAQVVRVAAATASAAGLSLLTKPAVDPETIRAVIRYSWPHLFTFTFGYFSAFCEPFLINAYVGVSSVGVYNVAFQVSLLCATLLSPVSQLLFPAITGYRVRHEEHVTAHMLERLVPQGVLLVNVALLFIMVGARFGMRAVFGAAYEGAVIPMMILLVAVGFQAVTICFSPVLAAYDMTRESALLNTVGGVAAHLVPQLILIPMLGVSGAAFSWVIWYVFSSVVCLLLVERRLNLRLRHVLVVPAITGLGAWALVSERSTIIGPIAVVLILIAGVAWARARNIFSSADAELLASLGVPTAVRRLATAAYSSAGNRT